MGATAQLNARMSQELKSSGDAALAEVGISPTKLVRLVWEKAASGKEGLHQLLDVLQNNDARERELVRADEYSSVEVRSARGEQLFAKGMTRLGLSQEATEYATTISDWKDLRDEMICDRLAKRGIL